MTCGFAPSCTSAARIFVLVKMCAIEEREPVLVAREVRRHPVEDHADASVVQRVDQRHQVLRLAVARDELVVGHDPEVIALEDDAHHIAVNMTVSGKTARMS